MNQRQFASVLFAVVGIYIAVSWLPQIVIAIGLLVQPMETAAGHRENAVYAITVVIGTLLAVLLGIGLLVWRERLAERLFAAETGPLDSRDSLAVALAVLGCYFAIGAIPRLVRVGRSGFGELEWVAVAQGALGVALFFGARGVARLWSVARSAGSSSPDERAV